MAQTTTTKQPDTKEFEYFRLSPEGKIVEGWFTNGSTRAGKPTGEGYKCRIYQDGGLYYAENKDYGWYETRNVDTAADPVVVNLEGFKLDKPFKSYEDALQGIKEGIDDKALINKNYGK